MPRKHALSRSDFKHIAGGRFRREHGALFSLSVGPLPDPSARVPRVACVVSKKIAARAVTRNLVKRRCRAVARECIAGVREPLALAFYAKRGAADASYAEIKEDVGRLVKKALGR